MSGNTFGQLFTLTTFGESHGLSIVNIQTLKTTV